MIINTTRFSFPDTEKLKFWQFFGNYVIIGLQNSFWHKIRFNDGDRISNNNKQIIQ